MTTETATKTRATRASKTNRLTGHGKPPRAPRQAKAPKAEAGITLEAVDAVLATNAEAGIDAQLDAVAELTQKARRQMIQANDAAKAAPRPAGAWPEVVGSRRLTYAEILLGFIDSLSDASEAPGTEAHAAQLTAGAGAVGVVLQAMVAAGAPGFAWADGVAQEFPVAEGLPALAVTKSTPIGTVLFRFGKALTDGGHDDEASAIGWLLYCLINLRLAVSPAAA
jgi:hypothetical protein